MEGNRWLSLEDTIELTEVLARIALECPTCRTLFKQAIENQRNHSRNFSRQVGGLLVGGNQSKEELRIVKHNIISAHR